MNVETMEKIMMCEIILHNMCEEEITADELVNEVDEHSDVIAGGGVNSMWCVMVRLTGQLFLQASVRLLRCVKLSALWWTR